MDIPQEWTFNTSGVADEFDAHVREQLPWYDLVTDAIVQIGRHYISEGGHVYDIGASTGNVGRALSETLAQRNATLIAIEAAPEMAAKYVGPGDLEVCRAETYAYQQFDFCVSMLALMFVPPSEARSLLRRLVEAIKPGGALVVVERMLPPSGYLSIVTSRLTLSAKAAMGAPADQIIAKELSIAGVQRPINARMMREVNAVEWFRFGDFAGYIIERDAA